MVLFTPAFLAIILASRLQQTSAVQAVATIAVISCFSIFAFMFAVGHSRTADTSAICAALIDRGLSDSICSGAIAALSYDSADGSHAVASRLGARSLGRFLIAYVAALAPFVYIIRLSERRTCGCIVLILLALPFVPLYPVAVDWGRWMSFHIFSVTIILTCAMVNNRLPIKRVPSDYHVMSLVALALLVSPAHTIGIRWGGAARQATSEIWRLLG